MASLNTTVENCQYQKTFSFKLINIICTNSTTVKRPTLEFLLFIQRKHFLDSFSMCMISGFMNI